LHNLLLHNGLSQAILSEILPFSPHVITSTARVLKDAGLVEKNQGLWNVSPSGYPIVRQYLNGEGYLTDSF
jgi:predicted transcriptional regulator